MRFYPHISLLCAIRCHEVVECTSKESDYSYYDHILLIFIGLIVKRAAFAASLLLEVFFIERLYCIIYVIQSLLEA